MNKQNPAFTSPRLRRLPCSVFLLADVLAAIAAVASPVARILPQTASHSFTANPAKQNRALTFADRVAYQRAIEEVYWRHRIWPEDRPDPKPSLDAVMSQAQLENKVANYLAKSQAL